MLRCATLSAVLCLCSCTYNLQLHYTRMGIGVDPAADAIDAAWRDHIEAARRKDLPAVCAIYTDDVVYAVVGQPLVRGRAEIEAMEKASLAAADVANAIHATWALHVDGDVAHEIGSVSGEVTPKDGPVRWVMFHYVAAWHRGPGDSWRIAHLVGHMEADKAQ